MANLKDTIILGNLTVTGSVVASDILVSGTGNEFDIIKVNRIEPKSGATIEIGNILNETNWSIGTTGSLTLESVGAVNISSLSTGSININGQTMDITTINTGIFTINLEGTAYIALDNVDSQVVVHQIIAPNTNGTIDCGTPANMWASVSAKQYIASNTNCYGSTPNVTNMTPGSDGQVLTSGGSDGNSYWKGIYAHHLTIIETDTSACRYQCTIINNSSTSLNSNPNVATFSNLLYNLGFTSSSCCLPASGVYTGSGRVIGIYGYSATSTYSNYFGIVYINSSNVVKTTQVSSPCNIQDMIQML